MTEGLHHWGRSKSVGDLRHCSKPAPDIGEVGGGGEVEDGLLEAVRGLDPRGCDVESQVLNRGLSKLKLRRVQDNAMFATQIKEITGTFKSCFN